MPNSQTAHTVSSYPAMQAETRSTALAAWLKVNGFNALFVDHMRIASGVKWREALRATAGTCRSPGGLERCKVAQR